MLTILFYIISTIIRGFVFYSFKSTYWSMQPSLFVFTLYALSSPMSNGSSSFDMEIFLSVILFYTPVFDRTYYGIASSVRPSVCPSVCPGLIGRSVSSRILQLGTFDQHDERRMPIVIQGRRLKVKVILSHSRKTWQDTL